MMYRYFVRPLLFLLEPEKSHSLTLKALNRLYCSWLLQRTIAHFPKKPTRVLGLEFPNPVGLAAGFDKNGCFIDTLFGLGFGFIEVGAVTPNPQTGNPKPRLFRIPKAKALINRMGFNNLGVDQLVLRLQQRKIKGILGVNIGKNATTPLRYAFDDYRICYKKVYPYADYVTINISSPNTPMLRELHAGVYLNEFLNKLKEEQRRLEDQHQRHVPLLLKISPDLNPAQVEEIAHIAINQHIEGIIAVNTTRSRSGVKGLTHAEEEGGLSGAPLFPKTSQMIKQLNQWLNKEVPIIAVGGIMSPKDAMDLFQAGAHLVQIYTGLVYQGPQLIRGIVKKLILEER